MAEKRVMLTQDGYDKLVKKLEHLKSVRRIEVADRLKAAIALGDLSENSEYVDAKNEQAFLEGEILDLEAKIVNSTIISSESTSDVIDIGNTVIIREIEEVKEITYALISKTYRLDNDELTEVGETDEVYKIVESDFKEIDGEKIYKLINVKVEELKDAVPEQSDNVYRLLEGGLVKLDDSNDIAEGKIYKITEGESENLYGKMGKVYKVYQYVDESEKYRIVGSTETNPNESKISDESPLGSALVGNKAGSIAEVHAPVGLILYEIVKIES